MARIVMHQSITIAMCQTYVHRPNRNQIYGTIKDSLIGDPDDLTSTTMQFPESPLICWLAMLASITCKYGRPFPTTHK